MGEGADTQSDEQRMIAGTMTLFGSFMMAMVFGNVAALINGMNSKAMEFQSHAQSCDEVMQYLQVPTEIQERVKQFFEYSWLRFRGVTGIEGFTAQLSPYLREEIVTYFRCHVVMEIAKCLLAMGLVCRIPRSNIRDVSSFYIDPRSHFRVYWDLTVVTLVIYTTVSIPFQFAFNPDQPQALEVLDYLIDALFVVDIWLNFYTAFFDSFGRMKAKKEHIVSNYMGGWFMWDVLATIPAEVILVAVDQGGGQAQLFSLLKFPRLLRLGRIIK
eukprot:gene23916-29019_t